MNTKVSSNYNEDEEGITPKFSRNLTMEIEEVKPQTRDHWNREEIKFLTSLLGGLSIA